MKVLTLYPLPAMALACGYNSKLYFDYTTDYRGDVLINTYYSNRLDGTIAGKAYIVAELVEIREIGVYTRKLYQWNFDNIRVVEPVRLHKKNQKKIRKLRNLSTISYEDLNVCPEVEDVGFDAVRDWQYKYLIPHIAGVTKSSRGYFKIHDIRDYL